MPSRIDLLRDSQKLRIRGVLRTKCPRKTSSESSLKVPLNSDLWGGKAKNKPV
jgi:hypothetical protein